MPKRRNTIRRSKRQTAKRGRRVTQRGPIEDLAAEFSTISVRKTARQFQIFDSYIEAFAGMSPRPADCVINAMEILRILDAQSAGISRILVGEMGVQPRAIIEIFDMVYRSSHEWTASNQNSFQLFVDTLMPGYAYFCAIEFLEAIGGIGGHAIVVSKSSDGRAWILDPQLARNPSIPRIGNFLFPLENYQTAPIGNIFILSVRI